MQLPTHIVLLLVSIILLVQVCHLIHVSIAQSPPIIHQEFPDTNLDWMTDWQPQHLRPIIVGHNNSDIKAISFWSNGRFLNSTIWFGPTLTEFNPNVTYGILFDVDSNNNTGFQGADYLLETGKPNNNSTNLIMKLFELSKLGNRSMYNSTIDTDMKKGYVHLDLDLNRIGNPPKFLVKFFTSEKMEINGISKVLIDDTAWYSIPNPVIQLILSPSNITLNPGQKGFVDLQVSSNVSIPLYTEIYYSNNVGVGSTFYNKHTIASILDPYSHYSYRLELQATDYAIENANYIVPVEASIFPTESGSNYPLGKFKEIIDVTIHKVTISDYLTTAKRELDEAWRDNKDIMILIIGAFLTPFAAYLFKKYIERKKSKTETGEGPLYPSF